MYTLVNIFPYIFILSCQTLWIHAPVNPKIHIMHIDFFPHSDRIKKFKHIEMCVAFFDSQTKALLLNLKTFSVKKTFFLTICIIQSSSAQNVSFSNISKEKEIYEKIWKFLLEEKKKSFLCHFQNTICDQKYV